MDDPRPNPDDFATHASYLHALDVWFVSRAGRRIVPAYEEGAEEFCVECYAGCSPEFHPQQGRDSYGDCAVDGGPVLWTMTR